MPLKQIVKRADVEVAVRKRTCKFTGKSITSGDLCLIVLEGPRERSCYSAETALRMIEKGKERLLELQRQLTKTDAISK